MDEFSAWLSPQMLSQITQYAVRIAGVLLLLLVARVVAGWISRIVSAALERSKFDLTLTRFFTKLAYYLVLILSILACLSVFGVETTSFAAVIAAAGLAIGLAFQGTLSNFAAGVMLLTFRPFQVGHVVKAGGEMGTVAEIGLFTTTLNSPSRHRIILPNSQAAGGVIENFSVEPIRRVDVNVGVDYSADLRKVREVLEGVVAAEPDRIEGEKSQAVLLELGDSAVSWQVRVFAKAENFWPVKERVTQAVKQALDEAGIGIPFPQMDVHLLKAD